MPDDDRAAPTSAPPTAPLRHGGAVAAATGVGAAAVALVPGLVTGMRLPLQNLWAQQTLPEDMPLALLPLSQYTVVLVGAMIVVAYGVAGVVVRALGARLPRRAPLAAAGGALLIHVVAAAQAMTTVAGGLQDRPASVVYLAALGVVVVGAVLLGLLVLALLTARRGAAAMVGATLLALAVAPWLSGLLAPVGELPGPLATVLLRVLPWVPGVLVGLVVAWGGVATRGRVLAAAGALLLLWIGPAVLTAVSAAAGSRALLPYPAEMLDYGLGVLRAAATDAALVVPRVTTAVAVAALGLVVRRTAPQPAAVTAG